MANEPDSQGAGGVEPEPPGPGPGDVSPPHPAAAARAGDSSNPEYDFELDLSLEVEPVDAHANTWGDSKVVDAGADTMGGMPGNGAAGEAQPLPEIPGYDILCVLSRGGMGVVYLARNRELDRLCALKMILSGEYASPDAIRRFLTEAGTAARLRHPGIVHVYRLGQHEGRPFLELEFLDGGALARRMDGTPWEPQRAASLIVPVAEAVAEAHRQGVVHRDLKPGNILLDADDRPKVSDFGLARSIHQVSDLTESGQILGSPWYMAPEQASGQTREVRPPADVHALGAVLYELLTGRPPFKAASVLGTLELVKSSPPVSPRRLIPTVPKDLETIILHCLEKNPDARYADAGALAEDLSRFLRGDSVRARPIGLLVRCGRWCGRNPLLAAMEAALLGSLVVTTMILWLLYLRGNLSAREERFLNARLRQQIETAEAALEDSRNNGKALRATLQALDRITYTDRVNLAQATYEAGDLPRFHDLLERLTPRPESAAPRGWEYGYLRRLGEGERPIVLEADGEVAVTAFSPDGRTLAEIGRDGRIRLRDARSGSLLRTLEPPGGRFLALCLAFSPDGRTLAAGGADRGVMLWEVPTGVPLGAFPVQGGAVWSVLYSSDGRTLAITDDGGRVTLGDLASGRVRLQFSGPSGGILDLAFSPDGRQLALASTDGKVHVHDARNGKELRALYGHDGPAYALSYAPDGATLASGGRDGLIQLWDPGTGEMLATLTGHTGEVRAVAFHPGGDRLASGGSDLAVMVWDLASGQAMLRINGVPATVSRLAFCPVGLTLSCASQGGEVRLWEADPPPIRRKRSRVSDRPREEGQAPNVQM